MENDASKRKDFLLRKNRGRLELENLDIHLKRNGIHVVSLLPLDESDKATHLMQSKSVIDTKSELSRIDFFENINKIFFEHANGNGYLWTVFSVYCGLIEMPAPPSAENIISILDDKYFGGYLTFYFLNSKVRLDVDIDEDPNKNDNWHYSFSLSRF